jgi:hypothetical protein
MKKKEADGVKEEESGKKLPQKTATNELETKTTTGTKELATKKTATGANELGAKKTATGFTPSWRERLNK